MDKKLDELEFQITQFTQAVEDLEANFPDTEVFGSTRARTPIICKYKIRWLLEVLGEASVEEDVLDAYKHTSERFKQFLDDHRTQYEQSVFEEFDWFAEQYPKLVCAFLERDPVTNELIETLDRRDTMESLRRYLTQIDSSKSSAVESRIDRATIRINALDEVLRCRFVENLSEILTDHSHIERSYFPDDFWWRHPEALE